MSAHTPNLLETVKRLVRAFEDPDRIDPFIAFAVIEQAKEAIRLAEGRE